jgi:hypothetical protein
MIQTELYPVRLGLPNPHACGSLPPSPATEDEGL